MSSEDICHALSHVCGFCQFILDEILRICQCWSLDTPSSDLMQRLTMEAFICFKLSAFPVHVSAPYSKVAITTAQYTSSLMAKFRCLWKIDGLRHAQALDV